MQYDEDSLETLLTLLIFHHGNYMGKLNFMLKPMEEVYFYCRIKELTLWKITAENL